MPQVSLPAVGSLTGGGEQKGGGEKRNIRLTFSLFWGGSLMSEVHFQASAVRLNPSDHFKSWRSTWSTTSIVRSLHHVLIFDRVSSRCSSWFYLLSFHNQNCRYTGLLCLLKHNKSDCCSSVHASTLPRGTSYELMRCQLRHHIFIYSISAKRGEKKHPSQRNWSITTLWILTVSGSLTFNFKTSSLRTTRSCFVATGLQIQSVCFYVTFMCSFIVDLFGGWIVNQAKYLFYLF